MTGLFKTYQRSTLYLMATDFLFLYGGFALAIYVRTVTATDIIHLTAPHMVTELLFMIPFSLFSMAVMHWLGLYKRKVILSRLWHFTQLIKATVIATLFYVVLQYFAKNPVLFVQSRLIVGLWGVFFFVLACVNRLAAYPLLRHLVSRSQLCRRVAVLGATENGREYARAWERETDSTISIAGFLDDHLQPGEEVLPGLQCLGRVHDLEEVARENELEGAVIACSDLPYGQLMDLVEQSIALFGWVDVHADSAACLHQPMISDTYVDLPFVRLREAGAPPAYDPLKRAMDITGSAMGIFLLSPLFLLTALLVKLTSPGPVLYVSDRIGTNGKPFRFYKFRSMRVGADRDADRLKRIEAVIREEDQAVSKVVDESQFTPIGKTIRRWAIDELPQLFSVLKGDMSLVGPRPVPRNEYDLQQEWQKRRFDIKPGCTGLWKLYATRENIPFNHTVLYDIYYARNMGPVMDLYIILGTIRLILTGKADG